MDPKNISISDFRYELPADRIAHYPVPERDGSRLLIYQNGQIVEDNFRHLDDHIPKETSLVFNNTRVIEARIIFRKESGAYIEIFCLEPPPEYGGIGPAMMRTGKVQWHCLIGGASKWKAGQILTKIIGTNDEPDLKQVRLEARYVGKTNGTFLLELSWSPENLSFAGLLHRAGSMPLPPYLRREAELSDTDRYQTLYAKLEGSVAAPTAGLHFTNAVFDSLKAKGIRKMFVTLHVGAGTFLPVKSATMGQHSMHKEFMEVTKEALAQLLDARRENRRLIIAVGTTSARTIESLYWLGLKVYLDPKMDGADLVVSQWEAYASEKCIPAELALESLLKWMEYRQINDLMAETQLLITPGYEWKIAGALITNFHQPESTLLLLVASMIGSDWKKIYEHALERGFRFLSYGDGCLLFPKPKIPPIHS